MGRGSYYNSQFVCVFLFPVTSYQIGPSRLQFSGIEGGYLLKMEFDEDWSKTLPIGLLFFSPPNFLKKRGEGAPFHASEFGKTVPKPFFLSFSVALLA